MSGSLDSAVSLVGGWVDEGVIPGAALLVSRGDEVLVERYWGVADMSRKVPATANTLWSIASITKPVTVQPGQSATLDWTLKQVPFTLEEIVTTATGPWLRNSMPMTYPPVLAKNRAPARARQSSHWCSVIPVL